jgi:hypothetical protein
LDAEIIHGRETLESQGFIAVGRKDFDAGLGLFDLAAGFVGEPITIIDRQITTGAVEDLQGHAELALAEALGLRRAGTL